MGCMPEFPALSVWGKPFLGGLACPIKDLKGGGEVVSVQSDSWPLLAGTTLSCSFLIPRWCPGSPAGLLSISLPKSAGM